MWPSEPSTHRLESEKDCPAPRAQRPPPPPPPPSIRLVHQPGRERQDLIMEAFRALLLYRQPLPSNQDMPVQYLRSPGES